MNSYGFEVPLLQYIGNSTALFMKDPDGIRFEVSYNSPGSKVVD